jgi:FkbH-like protein
VLAVCSKNEEDAARLPFQKHPDMLLREDDVSVFIANWTDKASNIRHIAKLLNIGTDALVFLDDNPAERERVRQMLPEVAVPELSDDPALYPTALAQAGYFETTGLSADDEQRADQYRANAARSVAMETIGDYGEYLKSLGMVCEARGFDDIGRTRIAQLINKSNQFNLTTRRYTEAEVAHMQQNPDLFTLQVRLADKFGDNGMISVMIFRKGTEDWICDTWLMSCRVLGRRVEEAALGLVADAARQAGAKRLIGEYIPSEKNRMVSGHFEKLGFAKTAEEADGRTIWQLDLAGYNAPAQLPMTLNSPPADAAA